MPMLEAFYQKHRSEGLTVIGLSADDAHERKAVSRAMQGLTYPAALLVDANPNGFGSTNNTSTLFGEITSYRAARRMQLALKLTF